MDAEQGGSVRVPFSYLDRQFADLESYLDDIRHFVRTGDFTLGAPLREFEARFASYCGVKFAVGVGSGTDALMLPLKAMGIGPGDEVITAANTFVATVGAIVMTGARPVFVDNEEGYVMDVGAVERAISPRTRAILPVHYTGNMADMPAIMGIAERHGLAVVEDACQAIGASVAGKVAGSWGAAAGFSLHPLKNINVWGDGGVVTTNDAALAERLRLWRNHGLRNRDEVAFYAHNSRLDTLQAVVGNRLIGELPTITARRIANAREYDRALADLEPMVRVPARGAGVKHVFHLYIVRVERRDELLRFLAERGVEAKIHYPIPMHLQEASRGLGYREGDFPMAEADAKRMITLPAHQHLTEREVRYVIQSVREFYGR